MKKKLKEMLLPLYTTPTSSSGKWQSNTRECFAACFVTSTTKFGVDTISGCNGKTGL